MRLNLGLSVPRDYLELIYDCIIQLAIGLEFAHDNNTVHGCLNLSNVLMIKDEENPIFKLNNFRHGSVTGQPLSIDANQWQFSKGRRKDFTPNEKKEILMLKDIYSLGICMLEMMIGRISENQYSITIDSLPLTWAELPESTPLIQVLVECLNIDSIGQRKGKLSSIKKILIKEYKKSFKRTFYKLEHIFTTDQSDILNKKAVFNNFRGADSTAIAYWNQALEMKKTHQDSVINLLFHRWKSAQISDQDVIEFLEEVDSISEKESSYMLKALFLIGVGDKTDGLTILKKILQGMKSQVGLEETKEEIEHNSILNNKEMQKEEEMTSQCVKSRVLPIFHRIQLEKDKYFLNQTIETEHTFPIIDISISGMARFMVSTSADSIIVWNCKATPKKILKIPLNLAEGSSAISCVDSKGAMLFCYRKLDNKIMAYSLNVQEATFEEKSSLECPKEMAREVLDSLAAEDYVSISEMYFMNDGKQLRCVQYEKNIVRYADYDMETGK